jgi:uncharacterized protein YjbI with pentapeptide repeats
MQKTTEQRRTTDNQREAALQAYIDKISELLLKEHLSELLPDGKADQKYRQEQNGNIKDELKPEYEAVRTIARVRTLTVLRGLDSIRKASVIQFLHESSLIDNNKCIIDLGDADLRGADLNGADLHGALLRGTDLRGADLRDAKLGGADLHAALLSGASLRDAFLFAADLSGASLRSANLYNAFLGTADLSGASLYNADLSGALLRGADLRGADLLEADLREAKNIAIEELEKQAASLKGTTMPDGSIHP